MDMALCCRACLQLEELMVHIHGEVVEDLQSDLRTLLEKCGGIQVDDSDGYPQFLCKECTSELLIAAKFREKCEKTQQLLKTSQWGETREPIIAKQEEQKFEDMVINALNEEQTTDTDVQALLESALSTTTAEVPSNEVMADIVEPETAAAAEEQQWSEEIVYDHGYTVAPSEPEQGPEPEQLLLFDVPVDEAQDEQVAIAHEQIIEEEPQQTPVQWEVLCSTKAAIDEKLTHVCDICGASFMQAGNLRRHMEKEHAVIELYKCPECGYCCRSALQLSTHTANECGNETTANTQQPARSHECSYCGKQTQSAFALNLHLRTHTGERPFACDHCPKAFKSQSALSLHLKRHSGVADYACGVCGKRFYESSNLTAHMRTHTGERPHGCSVCKKRFTRVFLLQLHMRTHTGERPYQCEQCDRAFAQKCDLRNHMLTHTGERKFQCPLCSKCFIRRYPLVLHMKKHAAGNVEAEQEVEKQNQVDMSQDVWLREEDHTSSAVAARGNFDWRDLIVREEEQEQDG